jgi:hypothetical protein
LYQPAQRELVGAHAVELVEVAARRERQPAVDQLAERLLALLDVRAQEAAPVGQLAFELPS